MSMSTRNAPGSGDPDRGAESALIVLVHGLWMTGLELFMLRRRLSASAGLPAVTFSYPTLAGSLDRHAGALVDFARRQGARRVHFVGHSLGGLVILRALEQAGDPFGGRAVLIGSPLQGSHAAREVLRVMPFARSLLGNAIYQECVETQSRHWDGNCDVGVIAGSRGVGLGRLFTPLEGDHDGTVRVAETQLPGARDHIVLPVSHSGMVLSGEVARQAGVFLETGAFQR